MKTFMLSSIMKNARQTTFQKKLQAKEGAKSSFYTFSHTRLFSMIFIFFCGIFFAIFLKVLHSI